MTKETIDLLFPDATLTPEVWEAKYPPRQLPEGAMVTRVAPSPTGFMHIGTVMTALFAERMARQTGGVFFLRVEDTDKKREVKGAVNIITKGLSYYGITVDEYPDGPYGPYTQSERKYIYLTYARHLVEKGFAYPCFATPEELEKARAEQEGLKTRPGYYGRWATWREGSEEAVHERLNAGVPFVIRMRSAGSHERKVSFDDAIKGKIMMPENDIDAVLIKADKLPTYHFAHVVDEHLMRVTHVTRGDEWLPSLSIHVELFGMFGWELPVFGHSAPIEKKEGSSRRKLSKRKDPEASVEHYEKEGYPAQSVQEFLLNLLNSNFEDWRKENPILTNNEFKLSFEKMSVSGALFDLAKLNDVSKEVISRMSAEQVYDLAIAWAKEHDEHLAQVIAGDKPYALTVLAIERNQEKPRKDIAKWSELWGEISYFYEEPEMGGETSVGAEHVKQSKEIVEAFIVEYDQQDDKERWLDKLRAMAERLGYARDTKSYKAEPEKYKGTLGDVTKVLRLLLAGRAVSPDLWEVMRVLGEKKVRARLGTICDLD